MFFNQPKTHTLYLDLQGGRWDIFFTTTLNPEPTVLFDGLTHLSSALQFLAECLRRLDGQGAILEVVDPTGEWTEWVESKFTIPTHTIF